MSKVDNKILYMGDTKSFKKRELSKYGIFWLQIMPVKLLHKKIYIMLKN